MEKFRNPQAIGLVVIAGLASISLVSTLLIRKTSQKVVQEALNAPETGLYSEIPVELQDSEYLERLQVATKVALLAGQAIRNGFSAKKKLKFKGNIDLVTETDQANERLIFETLRKHFPNDKFIGEESSSESGKIDELSDDPTWIVDPIDGTTNFVHSFPACAVSIGFAVGKELTLGVIVDPNQNEVFQVLKGKGAYLNGIRQKCSEETEINKAVVIQEFGYERTDEGIKKMLTVSETLLKHGVRALRQVGSGVLDLVYVGCGRADAVYTGLAGESWKPWDYAAGALFATECGCMMATVDGNAFDIYQKSMVCASSTEMLMEIIADCATAI